MKRVAMEALAAYALGVALGFVCLRGSGAQVWGGFLALNVLAASMLAGWAHLRRSAQDAAGESARSADLLWWGASFGIGAGLALGAAAAAHAFYSVAAMLPGRAASPELLLGIFLVGAICARSSFWTLEGLRAASELEEPPESAA